MIYCVIPAELENELYDRLVEYYRDNPDVQVIVDRRGRSDRRQAAQPQAGERRRTRDQRRGRIPGTFPDIVDE